MKEILCSDRMPTKKKFYKVWYTTRAINGNLSCSSESLEFDGVRFLDPRGKGFYPCSNFHCWDYWEDWDCPQCENEMFMCENQNKNTFRCIHCNHVEW